MKAALLALALLLAAQRVVAAETRPQPAARVHAVVVPDDTGFFLLDMFLDTVAVSMQIAAMQSAVPDSAVAPPPTPREPAYEQRAPPPYGSYRRQMDARQGLLLSFGLGGGSAFLSDQNAGRTGAFDLDFRLGYGFNDRFQLFMDFAVDAGRYPQSDEFASWTFTIRGQTVLIGDRAGNGLNLNAGVGVGGVDYNNGYLNQYSTSTGLALAGGLSYDARITPWFALSPELFVNWHEIPYGPGGDFSSRVWGLRLNFLWYLK